MYLSESLQDCRKTLIFGLIFFVCLFSTLSTNLRDKIQEEASVRILALGEIETITKQLKGAENDEICHSDSFQKI